MIEYIVIWELKRCNQTISHLVPSVCKEKKKKKTCFSYSVIIIMHIDNKNNTKGQHKFEENFVSCQCVWHYKAHTS